MILPQLKARLNIPKSLFSLYTLHHYILKAHALDKNICVYINIEEIYSLSSSSRDQLMRKLFLGQRVLHLDLLPLQKWLIWASLPWLEEQMPSLFF